METLVTPFGDFSMPPSFDASAGLINDMFMIFAGGAPLGGMYVVASPMSLCGAGYRNSTNSEVRQRLW